MTGRIFEIQRFSIHDGPGIRTTVFLKGCPLRCRWCHNPEGLTAAPVLSFLPDKCIGCGYCFRVCPMGAHRMEGDRHVLDRDRCTACGVCAEECYAGALERVGRDVTVEEILDEVMRDQPFYETSGGGMTLSGGEPLMQFDFSAALLRRAKEAGLHNALETSSFVDPSRLDCVREDVDLFLCDLKETDPARHEDYTGVPLAPILANLKRLHASGAQLRLRLPIVPGLNDRDDHFRAVAAFVAELPGLEGVEVMPYHRLGTSKIERFGLSASDFVQADAPAPETAAAWRARLRDLGAPVLGDD